MNNDLIRREYLEDAFDNLCCHNCKTCRNFRNEDSFYKCKLIENAPTVEEKSYAMGYQDGVEDGLDEIRPQCEWIPVSERLPEEEGDYLVQTYCGGLDIDHFVTNFVFYKRNVVAWLPIPKLYEGGKDK